MILISIPTIVHAQPDTLWTRYFNDGEGGYREECYRLIQTDDGGFLIGGKTYSEAEDLDQQWFEDYYVVKTDSNGVVEWSQNYEVSGRWRHDELGGIMQLPNGQFCVSGASNQTDFANILKIDSNGDSLWSLNYGSGEFNDVALSLDGFIVALGWTIEFEEFGGGCDLYIVKVDNDGEVIWRVVYGTGGNDLSFDIETTQDSGYIAVGYVSSVCQILKVNANGEQEWLRRYDFTDAGEVLFCVVELPDGGFLAGGTCGWDDAILVRFNSDGDTLWVRRGIPDFRVCIRDIVPAQGGGFVIVGGAGNINNYYDIMRVDDLGEEVWDFNVEFDGSASFTEATSIAALDDGGYLIGGNRFMRFDGGFSAGLIRTEPDTVVLPFELETEADYYDFGDLDVDSTLAWEFEIYNTGRRYAVIDTLWFEGSNTAAFTCSLELPLIINPLDTCLVPVLFSPSADTSYAAVLIIPYGDRQALRVLLDGNGYVNSVSDEPNVLYEFALYAVYPNPFNATTTITYGLDKSAPTRLILYDISGREVRTLFEGYSQAGFHSVNLNAGDLSSGLYFVRLEGSGQILTEKLMLIR